MYNSKHCWSFLFLEITRSEQTLQKYVADQHNTHREFYLQYSILIYFNTVSALVDT